MGDPVVSIERAGWSPAYQLRDDPRSRARGRWGRIRGASVVSPGEGNGARRDGRRGVGASHISVEAGERPFRTPWSKGDAASWTEGRLHAGDTEPRNMYPQGRRIVRGTAKPRRDEPDALIGQVRICGSPREQSLGRPGLRQEARKRRKALLETFCRNPAGNQSRPVEPGQRPEASLAWGGATLTAKRRQ